MKYLVFLFLSLLLTYNSNAQNFSMGFTYSDVVSSKNYASSSVYTLEGDYAILNNYLKFGLTASIVDAKIYKTFIKNPPPLEIGPTELSYKLGIQIKFYPLTFTNNTSNFKPYIGLELGDYISNYVSTYLNMLPSCEVDYLIHLPNSIYSNVNLGSDIFLDETFGINLSCKYQIFNPTISYEKPNCSAGYATDFIKYKEKVNLNILFWTFGFRINF